MRKKWFFISLVIVFTISFIVTGSFVFAGGDKEDGAMVDEEGVRTVAPREDALDGPRVVSEELSADSFPGLDEIGVAPKKQYFLAFSNGEDSSDWTRALRDDMVETAKKYEESYGIKFEWTNAGFDTTKQLSDCQSLIAKKPDMLFVMPNEAEPCTVIAEWCNEAGVPLIIINNQINATPGEGMFISTFKADFYLNGLWHGIALVEALEEKHGAPKGDIAEVQGLLGATPATRRGEAVRYVFSKYPDINIVISRPGDWDAKTSYAAAQDMLTVMPDGTLDGMIAAFDGSALAADNLMKSMGRKDIGNRITGNDGSVAALKGLLNGAILVSPETSPLYATMAFEYAIQYLNGTDIPASVTNPQRIYMAKTPEQREALKEIIEYCEANGLLFAPTGLGYYDVFPAFTDEVKEMYPKPYWELDPNDKTYFPEPWVEEESTIR